MPKTVITESDFLLLRSEADEAAKEVRKESPDKVILPEEKGGVPSIEIVSAGDLFLATLSNLAKAARKLKGSDIAIDMGSEPMEMKFTGTIAGLSKEEREIYLKLES